MVNVDQLINELLVREGGYVNDPDDPGGATNFGITIHTLSEVEGRKCTPSDVRALSKSKAKEIYRELYYIKPNIHKVPMELQGSVFDMYVNAGTRAVKILQETLGLFGHNMGVDGVLGPITQKTANDVFRDVGVYLVDAYAIERREFYYRLADGRKSSRKYANTRAGNKGGWIKRAEEFMSEKYRYSLDDHRKRTANWR